MAMKTKNPRHQRKIRIRKKISGTATKPRLAVFKSNKNIYVALPVEKKPPVDLIGKISAKNKKTKGVIKWKLFKFDFLKYFSKKVLINIEENRIRIIKKPNTPRLVNISK